MNNTNPLNNQSYINKDFQTIYPELLELIKKLTYKWDPTISNESDPGVLLVKLNAIIADKNNYNIDKNLLECFPDTVTQDSNAHKLFGQLGYNMHWYKSAEGSVTLRWNTDKILADGMPIEYPIPQFTMLCDEDKEVVYTTLSEVSLSTDGKSTQVDVMQGIIRDYSFGSTTLITPSFLDTNNRLYFPISNVAENGIFISEATNNSGQDDYKFVWSRYDDYGWKKVDNLHIQTAGTLCYKFGIDQLTNNCYIEFPADIADLMGEGIFIKYLQTDGKAGNIGVNRINTFYSDLEYKQQNSLDQRPERTISNDIKLWNVNSIINGEDPETIDEAYVGYQKRVGTFDTLVTLTDYLNYIVNEDFGEVSNGVVSDRTNDIQDSYKIVTTEDDTTVIKTHFTEETKMAPYDLKTYFLEYSDISDIQYDGTAEAQKLALKKEYDKSFQLKMDAYNDPLATSRTIKGYFEDAKAIQHNFINKLPNRPLFYKNKFDIDMTIIPHTMVTNAQAQEIERNVYHALYKNLLSKNISFGKEITYEKVYDICNNADSRIKAVALDNINYVTYAVVYVDEEWIKAGHQYKDIEGNTVTPVNGVNEIPIFIKEDIINEGQLDLDNLTIGEDIALEILAKNVLSGTTPMYVSENSFKFDISHATPRIDTDIEKADTYAEIKFEDVTSTSTNGQWVYQDIKENEALILYAPSLIDEASYSSGVKYIYYTTQDYIGTYGDYLPANRDLTLQNGQFLWVLWKEEDSKDAPYFYIKYGPGTIINSTTRLKTTSMDENGEIRTRFTSDGYEGEGQILGDFNDVLYEISDTILTGSKTITVKKVNSAKLNDTRTDCYWITNSQSEDDNGNKCYDMTFEFAESIEPKEVETVYQSGQVYVSNFGLTGRECEQYSLDTNEYIYILQPVGYKNTVRTLNEAGFPDSYEEIVYNYRVVDTITEGTTILCTGNIFSRDVEKDVYEVATESYDEDETYYYINNNKITQLEVEPGFIPWTPTLDTYARLGKEYCCYDPEKNTYTGFYYSVGSSFAGIGPEIVVCEKIYPPTSNTYYIKTGKKNLFEEVKKKVDSGETVIEWGENIPFKALNASGVSTDCETPHYEFISEELRRTETYTLKNGYKIEKYISKYESGDPPFGTGTTGTSIFSYRLRTNEYFVYTNDARDSLYILEEGTTISVEVPNKEVKFSIYEDGTIRKVSPITLTVPISLDTDGIKTAEMRTFKDEMWYTFRPTGDLDDTGKIKLKENGKALNLTGGMIPIVTENQILKLGSGTTVRIKQQPITYRTPDGTDGNLISDSYSTKTHFDSRYNHIKVDSDGVYRRATTTDEYGHDQRWTYDPKALMNYSISYKAEGETSYTDVTQAESFELGWNGFTILSLNSGANSPQKLDRDHNHKITLYKKGHDESITIPPTEFNDKTYYVQTNHNISLPGGKGINLTAENVDGDIYYMDVYTYTLNDLGEYITKEDTGHSVTLNSVNEWQCTIPMNVLAPIYDMRNAGLILPVKLLDKLDSGCVTLSFCYGENMDIVGEEIVPIGHESTPVSKNGMYYYKLSSKLGDTTNEVSGILLKASDVENPVAVRLLPLFTFIYNDKLAEVVESSTLEMAVGKLDTDNEFDYTYQPLEDNEILNPLDSKEFFNRNHAFNRYVIPQISSIKIKTMNKRS